MTPKILPGFISEFKFRDQTTRFFIVSIADGIQNRQANSQFYEQDELTIIEEYFPRGGVYVDIGANVGNHAVYVGKFCEPSKIIVFELMPPSIEILKVNLLLNSISADLSNLGVGLSSAPGSVQMSFQPGNLGTARIVPNAIGSLKLVTGDSALGKTKVDFIKIDVEGHEIEVLKGLSKTIDVNRPIIFIEVDNENHNDFMTWIEANNYGIEKSMQRYAANKNYIIRSKSASQSL